MKEDIIAANISGLRSDIQSLAKQIAAWSRSFAQQATPAPQTQIDEKQLAAAIADRTEKLCTRSFQIVRR